MGSAAVAIVGSAGAIPALIELLGAMPSTFPLPVIVAQHLPASSPSVLQDILACRIQLAVEWATHGDAPKPGVVHVIRGGQQLRIERGKFVLSCLAPSPSGWLPSADLLLTSMADCYGAGAAGVVLSGALPVGIVGLRSIRQAGGITMAQSGRSSSHDAVPIAAIDLGKAEIISSPAGLAKALVIFGDHAAITAGGQYAPCATAAAIHDNRSPCIGDSPLD